MDPLFRWPGGKRWIAPALAALFEAGNPSRYMEPFVGGGAGFFRIEPSCAYLGDTNDELIATYDAVRDEPDKVFQSLDRLPINGSTDYYRVRSMRPHSEIDRAARFLYLRETAFGGLYRVNRAGEFNVPYGGLRRGRTYSLSEIEQASVLLQGANTAVASYEDLLENSGVGDFVFCDPPYIGEAGQPEMFSRYGGARFSLDDHRSLAKLLKEVVQAGAVVVVTTSAASALAKLYPREMFHQFAVSRSSRFAPSVDARAAVTERLFVSRSFPLERRAIRRRLLTKLA